MPDPTYKIERMTLDNMTPGVAAQFAEAIARVCEVFHDDSDRYDKDKRRAKITISVALEHDMETGATSVTTGMAVALPSFRQTRGAVRAAYGASHMTVDVEAEQLPLTSRTPLTVHSKEE